MAKAHIPKSTKISGTKWRVVCKRNVVHEDGEQCAGLCHYDHKLIEVSVDSGDEFTIMANWFHELGHALIEESGVSLTDNEEHAIIKQWEKLLAANCDWRERPRKQKVTRPPSTNNSSGHASAKKRKSGG